MQTVSRYIYVGASSYSFTDDKGRPVQGSKLFLVPTEMAKKENVTGYAVDVVNADYGLFVRVLGILGEAQKEQQKAS